MKTAERNFRCGVYTNDLAAPALANRLAAGSSALIVGSYGAEYYRFLLESRGVKTVILPEAPEEVDLIIAIVILRSYREEFMSAPYAVFIPKLRNVPPKLQEMLLDCVDLVAVLLPVWDKADIPAEISNVEELLSLKDRWFVMYYDPDLDDENAAGWVAALNFEPKQTWTPDGPMWT